MIKLARLICLQNFSNYFVLRIIQNRGESSQYDSSQLFESEKEQNRVLLFILKEI